MKQMIRIIKPSVLAVSVAIATITSPANAGLKDELNSMFSDMSNVTKPGVYESQRRGVVFGGRANVKNRIISQNVVSFVPPSIKAGCGGIDMFGGSFSFINTDQIVQLMRAVAQNAIGYAFQLALDAVCAPCSKHIAYLQNIVSTMNQHLGNSCQLAQGLVDGGLKAITEGLRKDEETKATDTGVGQDSFWSRMNEAATSLKKDRPNEYAKLVGNVTWNELQRNRAGQWFRHGDNDLMEAMMSMAGSIIVGDLIDDPEPAAGSSGGKTNKITPLLGNLLTLEELVFGSETGRQVKMYDCSNNFTTCAGADGATPPRIKQVNNFEGLDTRIRKQLLGGAGGYGIIARYARPDLALGGRLTESEKGFLAALPVGVGGMIRNLAPLSEEAAIQFVEESSALIAVDMSYSLAAELVRAVRSATLSSNSSFAKEASEIYEQSMRVLDQERRVLTERYGSLSEVMNRYQSHMELTNKQRYLYSTITNDGKK